MITMSHATTQTPRTVGATSSAGLAGSLHRNSLGKESAHILTAPFHSSRVLETRNGGSA
jgi:hypothetical protein